MSQPTVPSRSAHDVVRDGLTSAILAARLRERLDELDAERSRVADALQALVPAATSARIAKPSIIEALETSPGARSSMLALVCGRSTASVAAEIEKLAEAELVERDGLGWRLRDAVTGADRRSPS
jgi:hypothetical protein